MNARFRFQDLFERGVRDPYPFYHWLRAEAPVYWSPDIIPAWFLSRYDDVAAVAADPRRFSSRHIIDPGVRQEPQGGFWHVEADGVLFTDGAEHARRRALVGQAMSTLRLERIRARATELAHALLDRAVPSGAMDAMDDFAEPLCYTILQELAGADDLQQPILKRWASGISATFDPLGSPEDAAEGQQVCRELVSYFRGLIAKRRNAPRKDLVSALIAAERDGIKLSEEQVVGTLMQVMQSPDSTPMLITNALLALIRHPDQFDRLQREPKLAGKAVEECLRYDTPVLGFSRVATEDVSINGHLIRQGQFIFLLYGAANRDPARFPEPDRLDIGRHGIVQFAFGHGVHTCLGAPLARLLGEVALNALTERIWKLELVAEELRYRKHFVLHGLTTLPIRFRATS